ncbi:unnamed protein product, partial [Phaeothamnion confervicola]
LLAGAGGLLPSGAVADASAAVAAEAAAAAEAVARTASYWDARISDAAALDPQSLLRRARALDVPPLPPDLGGPQMFDGGFGGGGSVGGGPVGAAAAVGVGNGGVGTGGFVLGAVGGVGVAVSAAGGMVGAERRRDWRPRHGCALVATLTEHAAAVNRLAVASDQSFFVSASADGTCRVWELRGLDHNVAPASRVTYAQQGGRIVDACMCEGSHSVASASSDGTVHVWRVDLARSSSRSGSVGGGSYGGYSGGGYLGSYSGYGADGSGASDAENGYLSAPPLGVPRAALAPGSTGGNTIGSSGVGDDGPLRVNCTALVRSVAPGEGACLTVQQFNTDLSSLLIYSTQAGNVHACDLRARREPWVLRSRPELGYLTAVSPGTASDRGWLCSGTSRGYVLLWDLRFPLLVSLWRHSFGGPIHRLAASNSLPQDIGRNGVGSGGIYGSGYAGL